MGSGNTKGLRKVVQTTQKECKDDGKNGDSSAINAVQPTTSDVVRTEEPQDTTTKKENGEETTVKPAVGPKYDDPILVEYIEKSPELGETLNDYFEAVKSLRGCFESDCLIPTASCEGVDQYGRRLAKLYTRRRCRQTRVTVSSFIIRLGLPKLVCDIFVVLRSRFPEASTWDEKTTEASDEVENNNKDNSKEKEVNTTTDQPAPEEEEDEKKDLKSAQQCLSGGLGGAIMNHTDLNDDFCIACAEAGFISFMVEMCNEAKTCIPALVKQVNPETQRVKKYTKRGRMLTKFLGILHNLSRRTQCRFYFTSCGAVEIIVPLLKAEVTLFATKALLILAHLIDEKNNEMIMSDKEPIIFLIKSLEKALAASTRRYLGFSPLELTEGLGHIASNDMNKKLIGSHGAIPILVSMIQNAKTKDEKTEAAETLWTLAFDADNKELIRQDEQAMSALRELQGSESSETRKAAAGALWELGDKEKHSGEVQQGDGADPSPQHVMISYQWDVQGVVIQVRDKLRTLGFKVWLDIDKMGGSTLESMAAAVENAAVVLICVTQKYKDSPNCRSEAEYTYQLRRDVVPLMMEANYTPDGWLGMIVGAKLWIDFRGKHKLVSGLDKLVKELKERGKQARLEQPQQVTSADVLDASPDKPDVGKWTPEDVTTWLADSGLDKFSAAGVQLDGPLLIRLHDLRNESPEFFYSSILRDFNLSNVFEVLKFTDALDKLIG